MRIAQFCSDIQFEVIMIGDHRVSQFDHSGTSLFECLLEEDRLQSWV